MGGAPIERKNKTNKTIFITFNKYSFSPHGPMNSFPPPHYVAFSPHPSSL